MSAGSVLLLAGILAGQSRSSREIPLVSEFVGATIDVPEQEYYRIFDKVRGFLSAQFRETPDGFQALIRTKKGWVTRDYTRREFYDLSLAIDLTGPIDPGVWIELSGQRVFEETVAGIQELPLGVRMMLFYDSGRLGRGIYQGFTGHTLGLKNRLGMMKREPLEGLARIWYREHPTPDLKKDLRAYAASALAGMLLAEGWNRLTGVSNFDIRWRHRFAGGCFGLGFSPVIVHWFRVYRAPVHTVTIPRDTRMKIKTYAFIAFNE